MPHILCDAPRAASAGEPVWTIDNGAQFEYAFHCCRRGACFLPIERRLCRIHRLDGERVQQQSASADRDIRLASGEARSFECFGGALIHTDESGDERTFQTCDSFLLLSQQGDNSRGGICGPSVDLPARSAGCRQRQLRGGSTAAFWTYERAVVDCWATEHGRRRPSWRWVL